MKQKLLVILGATSTGKTDLALSFAKKLNGELVSVDSRQVYKFLDIGTGKLPNKKVKIKKQKDYWQVDNISIWMYDVISPQIRFNLYGYILKTQEVLARIKNSKKLPILVGGTGLYIRGLLEGVSDFGTIENSQLRQELENLEISEIIKKLNSINPDSLKNLNNSEINNKRRLIRLYEKSISGEGLKQFSPGIEKDFNVLKIGLKTERKILRQRIKERVVKRIKEGMIEESKKLLAEGILTYERMKELGLEYRYIAKFLKDEIKSKKELLEILSSKIGQYSKRQETWLKREKNVNWFDILEDDFNKQVEKKVFDWYNSP